MPNIFHGCLQQDTSFTNRTKSAQSEYSFVRVVQTPCFGIALSFGVSGFVWFFFFVLVTCVSYSFALSTFFLFCFNHQQDNWEWNFILSLVRLWCSPSSQIWQSVLNWSPSSLLFITQSTSINWSERWHMLTYQNAKCFEDALLI